jgi:DNA-binding MarR family transcriptional regulator
MFKPDPTSSEHLRVSDYPFYYMWHIASESQRRVREAIVEYGVSWQDWRVVFLLEEHDGIVISELAKESLIDPTALSRILSSLEKRNLVERRKEGGDQRYTRIFLTAEGKRLYRDIIPIPMRQLSSALHGISDREIKTLNRLLRKMKDNVYRSAYANPE